MQLDFELNSAELGQKLVAGTDEAGRGPLAGDVVAAAVILDPDRPISGLDDSKQLSENSRNECFGQIIDNALSYCIARASVEEIDRLNILQASLLAMHRAVTGLSRQPDFVYVDGNQLPRWPYSAKALVKGDSRLSCIADASVLAKVTRDKEMQLPLTRLLGTPPGDQTPKDQHVNKRAHQGRHDHINTNELCSHTQFPDSDDDRTAAAYVLLAGHCEFDLTLGLAMAEQGFVDAISEEENNHKNARRTSTGRFMDTIREEDKRKKNARSIGHVIGPNGKITMTSGIVSNQTSSHPPPIALQCAITVIIVMPYFLIHLSFSHHNKISCRV